MGTDEWVLVNGEMVFGAKGGIFPITFASDKVT